jgi:LysM repeat protein
MSSNPMTDAPEVYVVQPGDTLGGIARTYDTTTHVLAKMNRLQNPDRLAVGQRLVVSEKKVCAVVPLFIDRDRNPIKGLRYRIESRLASVFEGVSQLNGLGERFITKAEGDVVRILVRKLDGTWKLIHETQARVGEKLVTLKSGKIRLPLKMEPHPQTPDGLPVNDPPSAPTPKPVPIGTPRQASGDMHHPAAQGSDKGMKGQQTKTPQGATDTHYSKDRPDLQKYFALYTGEKITDTDWNEAARTIQCEIAVIQAFAHVESGKAPFDRYHRPTIQYERHKFAKHTGHKYDAVNADISGKPYTNKKFDKAGHAIAANDRYVADAYERFERAYGLDEDAAIMACSWGKFQVLGENWKDLRFQTVQKFLEAACTSERDHLIKLFVPFAMTVRDAKYGHGTLRNALIQKNWGDAAWLYNGPDYRKYDYDNQLKAAYEKIKTGVLGV